VARIAEAEHEGWTGEAEGLRISLAAAKDKLAQADSAIQRRGGAVELGMPGFPQVAGLAITASTPIDSARTAPADSPSETAVPEKSTP
jgi:hypothetical protein